MSKLEVDAIEPQSGTTLTLGASGDTVDVPGTEVKTNKVSPTSGTTLTLGDSGDTITIPSGATLSNLGTATGFGGGKVLQVITATDSTQRNTSSTSFITNSNTLSVTITPSSASNKVFVICHTTFGKTTGGDYAAATIFRDATNLGDGTYGLMSAYSDSGSNRMPGCMTILDSPNTTSATTYQVYYRASSGGADINWGPATGVITAFEIEG